MMGWDPSVRRKGDTRVPDHPSTRAVLAGLSEARVGSSAQGPVLEEASAAINQRRKDIVLPRKEQ